MFKWLNITIIAVLLLAGCTPPKVGTKASVKVSLDTYTVVMDSLTDLNTAGELSQSDIKTVNEWEPILWTGLQEYQLAVRTGTPTTEAVAKFLEALTKLEQIASKPRGP